METRKDNGTLSARSPMDVVTSTDADPAPEMPSELVGHSRYRIERFLGKGGMGCVWLARHLVLDRWVALKSIRMEYLQIPEVAARFKREIQALGRLQHANIATAFDAETIGSTTFLVSEYVAGKTLYECSVGKGLPIVQACKVIRDAALGLEHAHSCGLIHRDVKPGNLMLTPEGSVKILDFGLVSILDLPGHITSKGSLIGTPDYISPEQVTNPGSADHRSDIYSLGCTFYFLLAGRAPFADSPLVQKIEGHRRDTPAIIPNIPQGVYNVLQKMMAKRAEDRYASARDVAEALEPYCQDIIESQGTSNKREGISFVVKLCASIGFFLLLLLTVLFMFPSKWSKPIALLEPTQIVSGDPMSCSIDGNAMTLDGSAGQIWVNFEQNPASEHILRCRIRIKEYSDESYLKIVYQSLEKKEDYSLVISFRSNEFKGVWERSTPQAKERADLVAWPTLAKKDFQELQIRMESNRLFAKLDDEPPCSADFPTSEKRFLAIAAKGCTVDIVGLEEQVGRK